jgi:transposase
MISGIVQVLLSGCCCKDAPAVHGPRKTLYNRIQAGRRMVWSNLFHALASAEGIPTGLLIDSSAVKAHRCAAGGKRGKQDQATGRSRGGRIAAPPHRLYRRSCVGITFARLRSTTTFPTPS